MLVSLKVSQRLASTWPGVVYKTMASAPVLSLPPPPPLVPGQEVIEVEVASAPGPASSPADTEDADFDLAGHRGPRASGRCCWCNRAELIGFRVRVPKVWGLGALNPKP